MTTGCYEQLLLTKQISPYHIVAVAVVHCCLSSVLLSMRALLVVAVVAVAALCLFALHQVHKLLVSLLLSLLLLLLL